MGPWGREVNTEFEEAGQRRDGGSVSPISEGSPGFAGRWYQSLVLDLVVPRELVG